MRAAAIIVALLATIHMIDKIAAGITERAALQGEIQ